MKTEQKKEMPKAKLQKIMMDMRDDYLALAKKEENEYMRERYAERAQEIEKEYK
jgi:hypothetical protein